MHRRVLAGVSALSLVLSAGLVLAIDVPNLPPEFLPPPGLGAVRLADAIKNAKEGRVLPPAATDLLAKYPGADACWDQGRITMFYGVPMTRGKDAPDAASRFIDEHALAFGAGAIDARPLWDTPLGDLRFHVFHYQQFLGGLPVEQGRLTVLVRTTPEDPSSAIHNRVVLASGRLASVPAGGFAPDAWTADQALVSVQQHPRFASLPAWTAPEMVVYFGEGDFERPITPFRAWKFDGRDDAPETMRHFTFFVDAATGELVHARSNIHFADVTGQVRANVTPGSGADVTANPPVLTPLSNVMVIPSSGSSLATNASGDATFSTALSSLVLNTSVANGVYAPVAQIAGQELGTIQTASATIPAPGTGTLLLNPAPSEGTTSQVNALFHQTVTRNHFMSRAAPASTLLSAAVTANVNANNLGGITNCNAFQSGSTTNFFRNANGCNNSAFGSVVSHEYGHYIVSRLGLAQGAFGEGFGDTMSMMVFDDGIIGRNFFTNGGVVRNPLSPRIAYPCSGTEVHFCGQILGGVVWDMRNAFVARYTTTPGVEMMRQLHVNWAQVTAGGSGVNSAHPQTAIEFLTIDDNDGNLNNGTPNRSQIGSAFALHSISIPPLQQVSFSFPNGLPTLANPGVPTPIRVDVADLGGVAQPGTGMLYYRLNSVDPYTAVPMAVVGTNQYLATLPPASCPSTIQYYFAAQDTGGIVTTNPATAPASVYAAFAGTSAVVLDDDFEIDRGWAVSNVPSGASAIVGGWERGVPEATAAQPGSDHTPPPGVNCYATGLAAGAAIGTNDLDNGTTLLTSPTFSLAGAGDATISYWRWYDNSRGSSPNADVFLVEISSDNGGTWTTLETIGPATQNTGGWVSSELRLSNFPSVARTATMKVRFNASDLGNGSVVEAAVDDVLITKFGCPLCPADLDNGSGNGTRDNAVDINDLLYFLARFEAGDTAVDLDNGSGAGTPDGGVDISDLIFFLAHFEQGC